MEKKKNYVIMDLNKEEVELLEMIMECFDLSEEWMEGLASGMIKIALEIEIDGSKNPVRALSKMMWFSKIGNDEKTKKEKYVLGLRFVDITTDSQDIIKDYIIKNYLG